MTPDLRTLALAAAVLHTLQALGMAGLWQINRRLPGILLWAAGNACTAAALILISLQSPHSSRFATFLLANILMAGSAVFLYQGVCRFLGQPTHRLLVPTACLPALPVYIWYLYGDDRIVARIILMSALLALCYGLTARALFRERRPGLKLSTRFTGVMFLAGAAISVARAGIVLTGPPPVSLFSGSTAQLVNLLIVLILSYLWTIGTIFMINQRQNLEISERHAVQRRTERELAHALRDAQEQRLLRQQQLLARDLHDGLGGITANLALLATLGREVETTDAREKLLNHIEQMAIEGNREVRTLLNTLEREAMHWGDWLSEIRGHFVKTTAPHRIKADWRISGRPPSTTVGESAASLSLMRAVKEAIHNLARHSQATRASFHCTFSNGHIELSISDNGTGMSSPPPLGRGLRNMRRRIEELGGTFSIRSSKGTRIIFTAPVPLKYPECVLAHRLPPSSTLLT